MKMMNLALATTLITGAIFGVNIKSVDARTGGSINKPIDVVSLDFKIFNTNNISDDGNSNTGYFSQAIEKFEFRYFPAEELLAFDLNFSTGDLKTSLNPATNTIVYTFLSNNFALNFDDSTKTDITNKSGNILTLTIENFFGDSNRAVNDIAYIATLFEDNLSVDLGNTVKDLDGVVIDESAENVKLPYELKNECDPELGGENCLLSYTPFPSVPEPRTTLCFLVVLTAGSLLGHRKNKS